ncbi:hypothetical protein GCM10027298_38530 [Epidermidibacterium keratini]
MSKGPGLSERLVEAVGQRPVYLHVDCDVMEPGLFQTDYDVPGGLTLSDLRSCVDALADHECVGVEIGEYEGEGSATADELVGALEGVLHRLRR